MNRKVFLITGSRKGIGRSLSEYYLEEGHSVVGCSRNNSDLEHANYTHFICDVTDENSVIKVVKNIKNLFGRIDVLINNAGIASLNHSLLTPGSSVEQIFKTNYFGSFYFSRECAKLMTKRRYGRIVNFSTVAVPLNLEGEMVYASSKSAVEKMAKILSKELSNFNITVNTIGPTPIRTDLTRVVPIDKLNKIIEAQTIKRFGEIKDIINVIDFFISDQSDFITGQKIYLGGL